MSDLFDEEPAHRRRLVHGNKREQKFVLIVVLCALAVVCSYQIWAAQHAKAKAEQEERTRQELIRVKKYRFVTNAVSKYLLTPAAAIFQPVGDVSITAYTNYMGDVLYTANGVVHSQNLFGALLRDDYVVVFRDRLDGFEEVDARFGMNSGPRSSPERTIYR